MPQATDREISDDVRFRVLRALEQDPNLSQRALAEETGVSLGLVNYCLRGLVEKGHIKVRNFRNSRNKLGYAYVLTPQGIAARVALTRRFLKRRVAEYEVLKAEIEGLRREIGEDGEG